MTTASWSAGARSVKQLVDEGWFSFSVPAGVTGAAVGLVRSDRSTSPNEHIFGFRFIGGRYYVVEDGTVVSRGTGFSSSDTFSILVHQKAVYFCVNEGARPVTVEGFHFRLPGRPVARASRDASGSYYLDASLVAPGDAVVDASLNEIPPKPGGAVMMLPPSLTASEAGLDGVDISFRPLRLAMAQGGGVGADLSFVGLRMSAAEAGLDGIAVSFPPMAVSAGQDALELQGADIVMQAMTLSVAIDDTEIFAEMPPMAFAASEADFAYAAVSFRPMTVLAYAKSTTLFTPLLSVVLPSFQSAVMDLPEVTDTAVAAEFTYGSRYVVLADVAVASETVTGGSVNHDDVVVTGIASDALRLGGSMLVVQGAVCGESVALSGATLLTSVGRAAELLTPESVGEKLAVGGGKVGDSLFLGSTADVITGAWAADAADVRSALLVTAVGLAAEDVDYSTALPGDLLTSTALAGDFAHLQIDAHLTMQDVGVAGDQTFTRAAEALAWVMNTDTGAVSWYDNWHFTSMATVGGKVFAAGPDGLHTLGGDKDGADIIPAHVQYGFNEFGGYDRDGRPKPNEYKKRVQALWFGYHADGVLAASVETYGQGYDPLTYEMQPRDAMQPRNNRIIPGKGLSSRYWRIGIANTNGCAFEVHSIAAEVAESTRRI